MTNRNECTSLKVNPQVWKEAKKAAIDWEITLGELVERAVLEWIKNHPVTGVAT